MIDVALDGDGSTNVITVERALNELERHMLAALSRVPAPLGRVEWQMGAEGLLQESIALSEFEATKASLIEQGLVEEVGDNYRCHRATDLGRCVAIQLLSLSRLSRM